jgi:ABC-2 type transport system permease protein
MSTETSDVIHDIGFRHYDGPRLGRACVTRSLLIDTVRGSYGLGRPARSKVMPWLLAGGTVLPALIIALVTGVTGADRLPISYLDYLAPIGTATALFAAAAAPYAVSRDLRFGVLPLYLSRPMRRKDYVAARYAGLAISLFAVMAVPQTVLLLGALLAKLNVTDQFEGWIQGIIAAGLLAVLVAAIALLIASVTPRRGLGIAAIITTFTLLTGVSSILTGFFGSENTSIATYSAMLDPFRLVHGLVAMLFGIESQLYLVVPEGSEQLAVFALGYLVILAVFGLLLVRRYQKVGKL